MERELLSAKLVAKYLGGLKVPAGKAEIIRCARKNDAPYDVVLTLHRLPARQYGQLEDIGSSLDKIIARLGQDNLPAPA